MNEQTFSEQLKSHSRQTHDSVDALVMSMQPFANTENYGKFLQAQHEFHETVRPMYTDEMLDSQLGGLSGLSRAERVLQDMQDLDIKPADIDVKRPAPTDASRIGWLYCVEGSNVGAAILYKEAGRIELSDEYGAAHLAAHPEGRMRHWRAFKEKLDQSALDDNEKTLALQGAETAFAYYKSVIRAVFA